jgi:putative PEP-CTERM system histidine kinase
MPLLIFYTLDFSLLCTIPFAFRIRTDEKLLSLSLLQILVGLPLLAVQYYYTAHHLHLPHITPLLFLAEGSFALLWLAMACRLSGLPSEHKMSPNIFVLVQLVFGGLIAASAIYYFNRAPMLPLVDGALLFPLYGPMYFFTLALLLSMLTAAWRLEVFWRNFAPAKRWEYRFLIVGGYIACAALSWAASYRMTYLKLVPNHFNLLTDLILIAWAFIAWAIARHGLLSRKIIISRKTVYSFVAPTIFALYLIALGLIGFAMRAFGLQLPYVLFWLVLSCGLIATGLFLCSGKLRRKVYYFISSQFYIDKYEYRAEWLDLSNKLQGSKTEADVVRGLYEVLVQSFYTKIILVWVGDCSRGYTSISPHPHLELTPSVPYIPPDDPLVQYLRNRPYFYLARKDQDPSHRQLADAKTDFFIRQNLVLAAPLIIGDQLVGIIGLGPEFTGGRYGHDDFDLLAALGTQTASTLVAVRSAEELANERERKAWDRLSAFVLHDIKNAAAMLALVRANAPDNIHNPEFQKDMLEAVDDALIRMSKVQKRLNILKEEIIPEYTLIELRQFLNECCDALGKRLKGMSITLFCPAGVCINTDPQLLTRILENLFINAFDAGGDPPSAHLHVEPKNEQNHVRISITDNGTGICTELLPDGLFQPFKTTKTNGSGIGLWQVKQLIQLLNGEIQANNSTNGAAKFVLRLPFNNEPLS